MLSQEFPILGASADAYNDNIVIELKYQYSEKNIFQLNFKWYHK